MLKLSTLFGLHIQLQHLLGLFKHRLEITFFQFGFLFVWSSSAAVGGASAAYDWLSLWLAVVGASAAWAFGHGSCAALAFAQGFGGVRSSALGLGSVGRRLKSFQRGSEKMKTG